MSHLVILKMAPTRSGTEAEVYRIVGGAGALVGGEMGRGGRADCKYAEMYKA